MSESLTARWTWADEMALTPLGDNRFGVTVDDRWTSLQGAHGGVVAALALTAATTVVDGLDVDPRTRVRAATFGYVRGNRVGDLELAVDVVRQGRAVTATEVAVSQNGKPTTRARLWHSPPWDGMEFSEVGPPPVRGETVAMPAGAGPSHLSNVETHFDATTIPLGGGPRAEWRAWSRPLHGDRIDPAWLVMYADWFPPAVFAKATDFQRAVTIEYSIQIHDAADGWDLNGGYLAADLEAFHSHEGFAAEDGRFWLPDGRLLASSRQTRLAG